MSGRGRGDSVLDLNVEQVTTRDSWDDLLEESLGPTVFHTWEWKQFLEKTGSETRYVLLRDRKGDVMAGCAFAITSYLRFFRIHNSLPQPGLQGGGPLYKTGANKQAVCAALVDWLSRASLSSRIVGSRIVSTDEETASLLTPGGNSVPSKMGIMNIDLVKTPPDLIWNALLSSSGQERTDIHKLESQGLELKFDSDRKSLVDFESLHRATLKRLGAAQKPGSFYENLWDSLHPKFLRIGLVSKSGEPLCALANLEFARTKTIHLFLLGYRRDAFENSSLPLFALWKMVEWAWENGFRSMDLGGTSANNSERQYRFKAQFGAKLLHWYEVRMIPHHRFFPT